MQRLLLLCFLFLFTVTAHAGLLIEPLVGYNVATRLGDDSGKMGGAYGGRLGYQLLGFQLGLDYLNSTIEPKDKDFRDDFKSSEFGAFIGYKFPVFFRVYAGYVFAAQADKMDFYDEDDDAIDELTYTDGSGPKVGIGFTGLPFVAINLEMRNVTYHNIDYYDSTTDAKSELEEETKTTAYMLTLSLPLDF